jgi:hypothetical protein
MTTRSGRLIGYNQIGYETNEIEAAGVAARHLR